MSSMSFPQKPLITSDKTRREPAKKAVEPKKTSLPAQRPQEVLEWEQSDERVRAHRFGP